MATAAPPPMAAVGGLPPSPPSPVSAVGGGDGSGGDGDGGGGDGDGGGGDGGARRWWRRRRVKIRERQVELRKPKLEARHARVCDGRLALRGQRQEDGLVVQRSENLGVHGLAGNRVHDVRHAARPWRPCATNLGDEVFDGHALHVFDGRSVRLLAAPSPREAVRHVPELRGRVVRSAPRL